MMMLLLTGLALVAPGLIVELIAAARAPVGYQDEKGFHFGRQRTTEAEKFAYENPS